MCTPLVRNRWLNIPNKCLYLNIKRILGRRGTEIRLFDFLFISLCFPPVFSTHSASFHIRESKGKCCITISLPWQRGCDAAVNHHEYWYTRTSNSSIFVYSLKHTVYLTADSHLLMEGEMSLLFTSRNFPLQYVLMTLRQISNPNLCELIKLACCQKPVQDLLWLYRE